MTDRHRASASGFTLIELVIVMVVFGLLWLSLSYGMKTGLQLWDRQARAVAAQDQLDTTDRVLRQLLGAVIPPGPNGEPAFKGTEHSIDFATVLPSAVALSTRRADAGLELRDHRLVLRWKPRTHEQALGSESDPSEVELLSNVAAFDLAYWRTAVGTDAAGWQDSWPGSPRPPLIRVRLRFAEGDPRHWPDILVAPATDPEQE